MASRLRPLVVLMTLGSVFAIAWHLEVWVIPIAMAATATALVVGEQLGERVLAQRAATLALYVPEGEAEASEVEQAIAADLAATAVSDPEVLDHTVTRAEQSITDPWLRALATERLQLARDLAGGGDLPSPPGALSVLAWREVRLMALVVTFGLALAAAATRNHPLLVVFTLNVTAVGMGHGEARRRQRLLVVLCEEASAPPPQCPVLIPEVSVVAALASLTSSRRRVLARAISLVSAGRWHEREVALQRLVLATRGVPVRPRPTLTHDVFAWAAVATAATVGVMVL